jgi:hypothetical protein
VVCPTEETIVFKFFTGLEVCRISVGSQTPTEPNLELKNEAPDR